MSKSWSRPMLGLRVEQGRCEYGFHKTRCAKCLECQCHCGCSEYIVYRSADDCPDAAKHTLVPVGAYEYVGWFAWVEKKAKTHDQEQCPTCSFWVIWNRKKRP